MAHDLVWSAVNVSALTSDDWFKEYLHKNDFDSLYMLVESDPHYGRSVVTYLGPIQIVMDAIFQLVQEVTVHVDMNHHAGLHYRMGAVDVIPFVPLDANYNPSEAIISWAQQVGTLMPVILYEKSALNVENRSLKVIRKGGFEGLKLRFLKGENPCDFGDTKTGLKTGCVAIGWREPLLAYNLEFVTQDAAPLQKIAKKIRASSGGHPGLDAAVFSLSETRHHLSMNLRRFDRYSIESITNEILEQCSKEVHFHHSEVIGFIARSMSDSQEPDLMRWIKDLKETLKIANLRTEKVLESVVSQL